MAESSPFSLPFFVSMAFLFILRENQSSGRVEGHDCLPEGRSTGNGYFSDYEEISAGRAVFTNDQIRQSSRSVCTNFAEAYQRRKYTPYLLSQLNDCEAENTETDVSLDFAKDRLYITTDEQAGLNGRNKEVRKIIFYLINNRDKFI